MEILSFHQGSPEWAAHRAKHFNASDAPAMLGCSPYMTRSELLHRMHTGITPEVDPATQRRFDEGHQAEQLARPLAEEIIGEELAPLVGVSDRYSASFDGLTMIGDTAFEHKLLGQRLRDAMHEGCTGADMPMDYQIQMEQQCMVSGCERVLFMATRWAKDGTLLEERRCWYAPNPELRQKIVAGWDQFAADLAAYVPTEAAAPVVPAPMESLPAVVVQVQGALTVAGNLPAFGQALRSFIERIPLKPATDQQFADAEAACKALKKAEDALTQAEDGALAQISDVEQMRRAVADLKDLARTTRLATEKLVKAEKDARRTEKVMDARRAFDAHVERLQIDCKGVRLIVHAPDFGGAIKGLSSLASIDDKLTAALIAGQSEANTIASRVVNNLRTLDSVPQFAHLFADRQELAYKDAETLELLMQKRVDAEAARLEAERQRVQAEAQAKAEAVVKESLTVQPRATLDADPRFAAVVAGAPAKCDGDHGGPPCADPHCWSRDADEPATLKLRSINERLAPIALTEAGIRSLGIEPAGHDKRAVLYRESQFAEICQVLVLHLQSVVQPSEATA